MTTPETSNPFLTGEAELPQFQVLSGNGHATLCLGAWTVANSFQSAANNDELTALHAEVQELADALNAACEADPARHRTLLELYTPVFDPTWRPFG